MEKKTITSGPITVELQKGKKYAWCTCGESEKEPFCDFKGHKGTGLGPMYFDAEKDGIAYLCGCKKTKNPPYCDGTHNQKE
ncbi:MAG: CDGSH iron-sulfur domain-containing protein [Clostridiales bacterium]|nr:CDGSH iron-sulfur domain-containing protein [Clostridiales bacterium]